MSNPIEVDQRPEACIIRLGSDYESIYENQLTSLAEIDRVCLTADPARVILDLSVTKYFGSAFIGFLIRNSNRLRERGGELAVAGLATFCLMALKTTKSDQLLRLFDNVDDAVAAYSAQA